MKKLIGTVAVAALLATAAFAEGITFGSWGRALWIVGNSAEAQSASATSSTNFVTSWLGQSWGGAGPRTALSVHGSSDNVGFDLDFFGNGDGLGIGDNALVWAKPIDAIKVTFAAKNDQNVLRSDAAFGLWGWDRIGTIGAMDEEGWIFGSLLNKNVSVVVTPIEGLTIGAGFNVWTSSTGWSDPATYHGNNPNDGTVTKESNNFGAQIGRSGAIAAAYTIADVGTIKLGVQGQGKKYNKDGESKDRIEIDAAFELTAIENVYIALGARIPLIGSYDSKTLSDGTSGYGSSPVIVTAYGRIGVIENLTINLLAGFKINSYDIGDNKADGAFGFRFGGEVEYAFSNGVGVFGEIGYANGIWMVGSSADKTDTLTFGLGLTKGFSNGVIGVAFEGTTNAYGRNVLVSNEDLAWEIPFKIEYWF